MQYKPNVRAVTTGTVFLQFVGTCSDPRNPAEILSDKADPVPLYTSPYEPGVAYGKAQHCSTSQNNNFLCSIPKWASEKLPISLPPFKQKISISVPPPNVLWNRKFWEVQNWMGSPAKYAIGLPVHDIQTKTAQWLQ